MLNSMLRTGHAAGCCRQAAACMSLRHNGKEPYSCCIADRVTYDSRVHTECWVVQEERLAILLTILEVVNSVAHQNVFHPPYRAVWESSSIKQLLPCNSQLHEPHCTMPAAHPQHQVKCCAAASLHALPPSCYGPKSPFSSCTPCM